jgi:hypothetical protein
VKLDSPSIPRESLLIGNGQVIIVSPLFWLLYSTELDTHPHPEEIMNQAQNPFLEEVSFLLPLIAGTR